MNKELSEALLDFYQKILAPKFESIQKKQASHDGKFIDILGHFDDLYKHLEKLEEEYQMITFGMTPTACHFGAPNFFLVKKWLSSCRLKKIEKKDYVKVS